MSILDKRAILPTLVSTSAVAIELGCGPSKRDAAALGIDALDFPGVDLVGDVFEVLRAFPAGSVARCSSSHFVEHIDDLGGLLDELARVMPAGAELRIKVPHFSNPYFHSDPTHRHSFGLYTLSYFAQDDLLRRKVPNYGRTPAFALEAVRLGFDSPFPLRGLLRRLVGRFFNLATWLQEFHEENLCWLLPSYEIEFSLRRL